MSDNPSGAYQPGVSGQPTVTDSGLSDKDVFFAGTTTSGYSGNEFEFGPANNGENGNSAVQSVYLKELVIINQGSSDLSFQWERLFGTTLDSGVVPAMSTIIFRHLNKAGIAVRDRTPGSHTTFLIFGV